MKVEAGVCSMLKFYLYHIITWRKYGIFPERKIVFSKSVFVSVSIVYLAAN